MNRDAWHSSDPEWLKERKQLWKQHELNLKHSKRFDKNDLKYFKDYYLFGIEPKDKDGHYYDENITLPLLIKAWLYPDCSEQDWLKLKEEVLTTSFQPETDVTRSYSQLFELGKKCEYSKENSLGEGFYLGSEEKLVQFFCGKPGAPEVVPVENTNYLGYCFGTGMFLTFLTESVGWLLAEIRPNPFFIYQYLFENWKQSVYANGEYFEPLDVDSPPSMDIEDFDPDNIAVIAIYNKFKAALERLAKMRKNKLEFEEPRKSFFIELCDFLDSEDLPENLMKMWKKVQEEA